ncbi:hypothetical protein B0O80DRAFT_449200 [Mortierella sp. GBAus27b]|nr:hypothetical protein BGX31_000626 [Mortierella sp. GBA43]KAI8355409.1 hypothetical protein B0O80DRAFT_449200 [Mortierella sp. GBAus27b]
METAKLPHYKYVEWEKPETTFRMYIAYLSLLFDIGVLTYHFSTPFHPKFYVRTARRTILRLHIFSGCLEIMSCIGAYYAEDPTNWAYAAAFFAILSHVPSTFYQIPTVLGIKAFLVPSLAIVTGLHGYYAVNLALNPTSFHYLLSSYMTVHIYAWSRVFFALYYRFKLFESHRFSAAMLTSGMLLVPSVMGLYGNIILLAGVLTACIVLRMVKDSDFWVSWTTEHPRELAAAPEKKAVLETLIAAAEIANSVEDLSTKAPKDRYAHICSKVRSAKVRNQTPRDKAFTVFKAIDVDHNNELSVEEFKDFLIACGIRQDEMEGTLMLNSLFEGRDVVTVKEFSAWFTKNWVHSNTYSIPHLPRTPRSQAKLVFDILDTDSSGTLSLDELEHLLTSWGLPSGEAAGYLKVVDKNNSDGIDFDEFYQGMETIWKFAIQSFIDEGKIVVDP